jgi:hypothetical protein
MTNDDVLRDRLAEAVDEADRLRAVADRLAEALEMCAANDKTEYDYSGKARRNRNGAEPEMPGERFKTPREIAADALAEYRNAVADAR